MLKKLMFHFPFLVFRELLGGHSATMRTQP